MNIDENLRSAIIKQHSKGWLRPIANPFRTFWPQILRGLGAEHRTRADTFFGDVMEIVLPEVVSTHIYRDGFFEADVCTYMLAVLHRGGSFIDVGGHFGFFSMLGAKLTGPEGTVVTYEPMPASQEILKRNMQNKLPNGRHSLIPVAAGDRSGTLLFKDFGLVGSAYATSEQPRSSRFNLVQEIEVEMQPIDVLVSKMGFEQLDLIKIDAENAEMQVLKGASATLARLKPALILETGDMGDATTRPILDELVTNGYIALNLLDYKLARHEIKERYQYGNLLFAHKDRIDELKITQ